MSFDLLCLLSADQGIGPPQAAEKLRSAALCVRARLQSCRYALYFWVPRARFSGRRNGAEDFFSSLAESEALLEEILLSFDLLCLLSADQGIGPPQAAGKLRSAALCVRA